MIKNFKWLLLVSISFVACNNDDEVATPVVEPPVVVVPGSANFSNYVALGNSLTAGFTDGALYKAGQEVSWTKTLSEQFKLAGGGEFKVPYMKDNLGGLLLGGNVITENRFYFNGSGPARLPGVATNEIGVPLTGPFNNMGVPGAKIFHLVAPGYGNVAGVVLKKSNPYFVRFASSPNATILGDALAQKPTFFSLWIGNNDILSYATNGGDGINQTGNLDPSTYGGNDITDPNVFASVYNTLLTQLTAGGAKGVVSNIPDVTTVPYFTTVKYNQLTQSNLTVGGVSLVGTLNTQLYGPLNGALTFLGEPDRIKLLSETGNNPMLMVDETLTDLTAQLTQVLKQGLIAKGVPVATATAQATGLGIIFGKARQTKPTDYVCLTASSRIGKAPTIAEDGITSPAPSLNSLGVSFPLTDKYVLIPFEVSEIATATNSYNATILTLSTKFNLAFVDAKAILTQVNTAGGFPYDKYVLKSDLVFGGAFGLDGVHPTGRGYAHIANQFIKSINAKYGSNLPEVKLTNYPILRPASL
jgi:hypothetical protein